MSGFNVGDRVEVFVAEWMHCISPTEFQPMYRNFDGNEMEVPGGTGWIPGTIVGFDPDNIGQDGPCPIYDINYDHMFDRSEGVWVPIEYLRHGEDAATPVAQELDAWEWMGGKIRTYDRPIGVVKITHDKSVQVAVPIVKGYDCEDMYIEVYPNEEAFLKHYSWEKVSQTK